MITTLLLNMKASRVLKSIISQIYSLIILLIVGCLLTFQSLLSAKRISSTLDSQVITSMELSQAGVVRLSDIYPLIDNWNFITIDEFNYYAGNGSVSQFDSRWNLYIDDQYYAVDVFNTKNINSIPLSVNSIDSVEIINTPVILNGELSTSGVISIHTKKHSDKKKYLDMSVYMGNEINDPGPYRYIDKYETPNVDKKGVDYALNAGVNFSDDYHFGLNGVYEQYFITDVRIADRNWAILTDDNSSLRRNSRLGNMNFSSTNHAASLYYSDTDEHFFHISNGMQLPVYNAWYSSVFSGKLPLFKYSASYVYSTLREYPNALDINYDWNHHKVYLNLEKEINEVSFGLSVEKHFIHSAEHNINDVVSRAAYKPWLSRSFHITNDLTISSSLYFRINEQSDVSSNIMMSALYNVDKFNQLSSTIAFNQKHLEEYNTMEFWINEGYDFGGKDDPLTDIAKDDPPLHKNSYTAELVWKSKISKRMQMQMTSMYRFEEDYFAEKYSIQPNSSVEHLLFDDIYYTKADDNWSSFDLGFVFNHAVNNTFKYALSYKNQSSFEKQFFLANTDTTVPVHRASLKMGFNPDENFSIWTQFRYASSSEWEEYNVYNNEVDLKTFSGKIKEIKNIDLTFVKYLWQRRLKGTLMFRNLLNEEIVYHPMGSKLDLSFHIKVDVML